MKLQWNNPVLWAGAAVGGLLVSALGLIVGAFWGTGAAWLLDAGLTAAPVTAALVVRQLRAAREKAAAAKAKPEVKDAPAS